MTPLTTLNNQDQALVDAARRAAVNAYAPYSHFAVGAAARSASGKVYTGTNVENASYGLVICAEVSAITAAVSAGDYDIETIAVAGWKFWPEEAARAADQMAGVVTPCGRCRQVISEAAGVASRDVRVLCANKSGDEVAVRTIADLLPEAFGPGDLGITGTWPKMRAALKASLRCD